MDNFQIETAQNITISQNVAHVTTRIGSYLIDTAIIFCYYIVVLIIFRYMDYVPSLDDIVPAILMSIPILFYSLIFEIFMNGQTPGKFFNKIRVVKLDGGKPTLGSYLIRWFLRLFDVTLFGGSVAVITILMNGKGQRLGDIAAATTVISEKKRVRLKDTLLDSLQDNYTPTFPQVTVLSDKDVHTIRQVFNDAKHKNKHNVIIKLSAKIMELTGIKTDMYPETFVDTVIKDYYYYTQE